MYQGRALLYCVLDQCINALNRAVINHRAHINIAVAVVTHLYRCGTSQHFFTECIRHTGFHEHPVRRYTDLAGVGVLHTADHIGGEIQVRIGKYQCRRIATKLHGVALNRGGTGAHHVQPGLGGTDQGQQRGNRRGRNGIANLVVRTGNDIDHTGRQADLGAELAHRIGGKRGFGRRLDHNRAAGSQGRAELVGQVQQREVPGQEGRRHANGLTGQGVHVGAFAVHQGLGMHAGNFFRVKLQAVHQHLVVVFGGRPGLGHFQVNTLAQVGFIGQHGIAQLVHPADALGDAGGRPAGESGLSGFQRLVGIGYGRLGKRANHLIGCRIDHVQVAVTTQLTPDVHAFGQCHIQSPVACLAGGHA